MKKNNVIRKCSFKPEEYLLKGQETDDLGNVQETLYLPAYARLMWFNIYQAENNVIFSLTSQKVDSGREGIICYRATLSQIFFDENKNPIPIVIATGEGSVVADTQYANEFAETKAKGRALMTAGFNIPADLLQNFKEDSVLDRPPVVPDLIKKDNNKGTEKAKKSEKQKKEDINDKKGPTKNTDVENIPKQEVFPEIPSLESFFPSNNEFDKMTDEEKLSYCLNECFYPWNSKNFTKNDLVKDICLNPCFIQGLQWAIDNYEGHEMITDILSIKDWVKEISPYFINPDTEHRKMLTDVLIKLNN